MNAPEIARNIEQDIEDAKILKVTKTPEFFVNGKPMPSFGYEQLTALVGDALMKAYRKRRDPCARPVRDLPVGGVASAARAVTAIRIQRPNRPLSALPRSSVPVGGLLPFGVSVADFAGPDAGFPSAASQAPDPRQSAQRSIPRVPKGQPFRSPHRYARWSSPRPSHRP